MKMKYKLTFVHSLLCIGLLIMAVLFFCQPQAYKKELDYNPDNNVFPFLQKGDYTIYIYYNSAPADNTIRIYSDDMIDDNCEPGVEFLTVDIGRELGRADVLLSLEQDAYNVELDTVLDTDEKYYINLVALQSVQLQNKDHYLLGFLCAVSALIVFFVGKTMPPERYKEPAILIGLGVLASMPLFSDFIMDGDDLGYHVARLEAVYRGLRAGEFPVYLGTSHMGGFGSLSATMYPQLFLYPFALLRFFGVSLMLCYKALVVCMHMGSAFTAYYSAKHMCNSSKIGFWTSVFYTFSIYRLTNVYFRASLGEALAMVFLPLVMWGIYEVLWGNYKKWYLLALGVGGILQSHVLSVEMCVLFLVIEVLVWLFHKEKSQFGKRLMAGLKAAGITVLVNAFFLVPFLYFCGEDLQCFHMPNQLSDTGVYFSQMFSIFAGADGKEVLPGSTIGEMPHTIGFVLLLGAVLLCVEALQEEKKSREMQVGKRCLIYGAVTVILSSWLFPWDKLQSIDFLNSMITALQFAWRFLSLASVFLSVVSAVGLVRFTERLAERKWVYGVFAMLIICSTGYFFGMMGQERRQYSDKMIFNNYGFTDAMYMYRDSDSFEPYNLAYNWSDAYIKTLNDTEVEYYDYERSGTSLRVTAQIDTKVKDYLLFPLHYYPGYEILIDGEEVDPLTMERRLACEMPYGTVDIEVSYRGLPMYVVANWVSLITVLGIMVYNVSKQARKSICKRK